MAGVERSAEQVSRKTCLGEARLQKLEEAAALATMDTFRARALSARLPLLALKRDIVVLNSIHSSAEKPSAGESKG